MLLSQTLRAIVAAAAQQANNQRPHKHQNTFAAVAGLVRRFRAVGRWPVTGPRDQRELQVAAALAAGVRSSWGLPLRWDDASEWDGQNW